jgi:hypothetical protein
MSELKRVELTGIVSTTVCYWKSILTLLRSNQQVDSKESLEVSILLLQIGDGLYTLN